MKLIKKIIFAITVAHALFALLSCDKIETTSLAPREQMAVNPIVGLNHVKGIVSGTTFPTSRSMVVSADLMANTGGSGNYFSNLTFTCSNGVWSPENIYYWPLTGGLEMLAYSSGSASVTPEWTNATQVVLTCANCSADDILMGGLTSATASSKTIGFKHCLAQVNATVSASSASVIKVKSITLNAKKGATLTVTKSAGNSVPAVSTTLSGSATDNSLFSGNQSVTASATAIGSAMLLPEQTPGSMTITYTITNNGTESSAMTVTKTLSQALAAGSSYTYAIAFTLTGITVTASLTNWTDSSSTSVSI